MKTLLLFLSFLSCFNSFSQSYLIFDNGTVITLDRDGFSYDLGNYVFPQKVNVRGGNYYFEENKILTTIGDDGSLYRKFEILPEKINAKGFNFFFSDKGELFTIDSKGILKIQTRESFSLASYFGGNFFFLPSESDSSLLNLYVINTHGELVEIDQLSFKESEIAIVGGKYIMKTNGDLLTLGDNGEIVQNNDFRVGVIIKKGGNYFVDSSGIIFTIDEAGELKLPALPFGLKVELISKFGSRYFIDVLGQLFVIDSKGDISQRDVIDQDLRELRFVSY
jgi:hypothetical protein